MCRNWLWNQYLIYDIQNNNGFLFRHWGQQVRQGERGLVDEINPTTQPVLYSMSPDGMKEKVDCGQVINPKNKEL